VSELDLPALARVAAAAADRARREILPRFRKVGVEIKGDGSPVTEADRAAERAIRELLRDATPGFALLGEEYGAEGGEASGRPCWVVDPIDGTIAFSRGIPLFGTILALLDAKGDPVLGLLDCCALDERTLGWRGGGVTRNGEPVRASRATDLRRSIVSHGDVFCFDRAGQRPALERMVREIPCFRGYTDAFGHAQVVAGAVDVMVDLDLNPWDMTATRILVEEAGGKALVTPERAGKRGLVFGAPALVDELAGWLGVGSAA
jgi:histidinol phosphatase-like enzyme (inositol monophosphatase family)